MSFGEFHSKICNQLKAGHEWGSPIVFLGERAELMTVIYEQYQAHIKDDATDWRAVVETTCLKLDGLT